MSLVTSSANSVGVGKPMKVVFFLTLQYTIMNGRQKVIKATSRAAVQNMSRLTIAFIMCVAIFTDVRISKSRY